MYGVSRVGASGLERHTVLSIAPAGNLAGVQTGGADWRNDDGGSVGNQCATRFHERVSRAEQNGQQVLAHEEIAGEH